jgi:ribonucleoside-diphosphate reductase alpha chain
MDPFEQVTWEHRTASIVGEGGETVFEQRGVEFPSEWSQQATNVVASKYFRGTLETDEREYSVRQLISRVANTITGWGRADGYFSTPEDAEIFRDELTSLLLYQRMSFNSPVWFNVGVETDPQASACFINSVDDTLESILGLARTEGMLFKFGSGTGSNLSAIRSSKEGLTGGGQATGPLSFMRGFDAFAGAIRSGGKTRRAAKMVILNAEHPDIVDFIRSKATEEKKAHALIDAGYDGSFNGEAYRSVFFQNANHSVRVTDELMHAVEQDSDWQTKGVWDPALRETMPARQLWREIAQAAWDCGDPGMQYDTTINQWHTCPSSGRINGSNPCSEYMFLDDSACNLASLNLLSFLNEEDDFDIEGFTQAVRITILAQEILVSRASYPTHKIELNSHAFRPLGLGYANLGALLMRWALPYDSDEGRDVAAAITALMGGQAYATSAQIAAAQGSFEGYAKNRAGMLEVIEKHRRHARELPESQLQEAAKAAWELALDLGRTHGYRNSQVTVLAPTGTIAFMMDCDTTGVEPDIALVKYKRLSGGGMMRMVNRTVPAALAKLGYSSAQAADIVDYIESHDTIEQAPGFKEEHFAVFDCAFKATGGTRAISPMGHVRMMAAVQPFLSGAISKTVNLPNDATVEDIESIFIDGWRLGLKALAVYRDGCKRIQPLSTSKHADLPSTTAEGAEASYTPRRQQLPDERPSITHKFNIAGHKGYLTVGMYPDGRPGEIFIKMAKEGSTVSGLMDSFAKAISTSLQYGIPLDILSEQFVGTRFEPAGFTTHSTIPMAKSIMDYLFRWLRLKFPPVLDEPLKPVPAASSLPESAEVTSREELLVPKTDAPPCTECGSLMVVPNGSCHKCLNCGATSGCS